MVGAVTEKKIMTQPPANPSFNTAAPASPAQAAQLGQELLAELGTGRAPAADMTAVKNLMTRGASVTEKNTHGQNALMVALHYNHHDIAAQVLAKGAPVHARDAQDNTALIWCGYTAATDVAIALLRSGAKADEYNSIGRSVLTQAAAKGHDDFLTAMISYGLDANHIDKRGDNLLTAAVLAGQAATVKRLIELGADPQKPDRNNKLPADLARAKGAIKLAAAIEGEIHRKKKKEFTDTLRQITDGIRKDVTIPKPASIKNRRKP